MTIDKKRLATDAAYWDEVAPEGATHYWPQHKAWYQLNSEGLLLLNPSLGSNPKRCLPNIIEEPGMIRRPNKPAAPEWDGEGLPPVGCECEVKELYQQKWQPMRVTAVTDCFIIGYIRDDRESALDMYHNRYSYEFRPLRTPEQRQREELIELIGKQRPTIAELADAILSRYNLEPKK